ncbi:MAG TPA: hypothetical protein VKB93_12340 [Thermoanaerobaculia bacterium]|nr:hypothetical protein [Thermoanaerobaculia bacterium]
MDAVAHALQKHRLLLQQDPRLPSVAGLIAGEPLRGAWWSHPKGQEIFKRLRQLEDDDAVLVTRLVSAKVTYVHKTLWPAFLGVATSHTSWQLDGLSSAASKLLASAPTRAKGDAVRELQARLLVAANEVHTESGKHAIEIEAWTAWAKRNRAVPMKDVEAAMGELERAVVHYGAAVSSLPWHKGKAR